MLKKFIGGAIGVVIIGTAIPVLWPMIAESDTNIQAMTGTDVGTTTLQSWWPILLPIAAIAIGAMVVFFVIKKFRAGMG